MDSSSHKKYFEIAYRTGTDIWTHIPYAEKGGALLEKLSPGSLVLDLGSGRGTFAFHLAKLGLRVIGLEYVQQIVNTANQEVKNRKLDGQVAFMNGNVLEIPLADASFDAVTDFGVLQHLSRDEYTIYTKEVGRVLKPRQYYLNVSLSRETKQFMNFYPKASVDGVFEKDGLTYTFFTEEEIVKLFSQNFGLISQEIQMIPERDNVSYVVSLFQRK